jgi:hypothetical protein
MNPDRFLRRLEISELNHQASDEFQSAIHQRPPLPLPLSLPAQAPDEFQMAMKELKECNGNSEYFDLLEKLERKYKAKACLVEGRHTPDCPKKSPPFLEQGDKFEEVVNRLKRLLGRSVYRYALVVCEKEYKAKADSFVVSPSTACGDCGKMLGSVHDLKKMVTAPAPTPDSRNDVEIFKKALDALKASEDAPKIARELAAIEAHFDNFVLHAKDDYNKRHILAVLMNASNLLGQRKTDEGSILPKVHVNLG